MSSQEYQHRSTRVTASSKRRTAEEGDGIIGAIAVHGPDYEQLARRPDWDDSTVEVGGSVSGYQAAVASEEPPITMEALDATVVDDSRAEDSTNLPPLVEAEADRTCTRYDRRVQCAVFALFLVIVGVVLGIVFGVVLRESPSPPSPAPVQAPTISPAPTMTPQPTMAPTSLTWQEAGGIDVQGIEGPTFSLSPDGTRFAFALVASSDVQPQGGTVEVYQEQQGDGWTKLGNSINFDAVSVSLSDNRIAVGRINAGEVSVLELANNVWSTVGNVINTEGWTVALSRTGNVLAVEATDAVQVYELNESNTWITKGDAILTASSRTQIGNSYSRLAMSNDGNSVIVDISVYKYDPGTNTWTGTGLEMNFGERNTPVSMSGDGLVAAIAQPESDINGLNSGRVSVFLTSGGKFGGDIIGDGQVNGFLGSSHSLSENGNRIAVMNDPSGAEKNAEVFQLRGSSWIGLLDKVPVAVSNGTIGISDDGDRVAVGGEGIVRVFDIVGV